jgi:membrane associated rhomboid family serine protease
VQASDRAAVRLGSILSVVVGVWALGSVAVPFGVIGGAAAALFGLIFGGLAILARAWGRWRKTALVGIAISGVALLVAAAEVVHAVLVD